MLFFLRPGGNKVRNCCKQRFQPSESFLSSTNMFFSNREMNQDQSFPATLFAFDDSAFPDEELLGQKFWLSSKVFLHLD